MNNPAEGTNPKSEMDPRISSVKGDKQMRIMLILSALGLILFLLLAATFPFKDRLLQYLFPKPPSKAAGEITFPNTSSSNAYVVEFWTKTILATNNSVYLGGQIHHVGPNTGKGVPIEATSGARVNPYPYVQGYVTSSIPDGNNGWYIGGGFNKVGDKNITLVAHILADGTVDNSFDAQIPYDAGGSYGHDYVNALVLSPDKSILYIGGKFESVGGEIRNNLAAVNAATGTTTSFNPGITTMGGVSQLANVRSLLVSFNGGTLYVGGHFTTVGGQARSNLVSIDTTTGGLLPGLLILMVMFLLQSFLLMA